MATGESIRTMIADLEQREGLEMSPVERLLLATDGTVTHMLEALTRGPVNVNILSRDVSGGTLNRKVVLEREQDGSRLVWARSQVNLFHLEEKTTAALVEGDIGIGHLLREECRETRRELVSVDPVRYDVSDFPMFIDKHVPFLLQRKYKVYHEGNRIMTITEYFPKGLF